MELFILATIINVIFSTVRSLLTIKGTPLVASIANAITYGFYSIVIVLTANDNLNLWFKVIVTALANLVGVYVVKLIEKKRTPDKLWQVVMTCYTNDYPTIIKELNKNNIQNCYYEMGKHTKIEAYANSQKESSLIANIIKPYKVRYFVNESKGLLS